jgi:hypothetical protein
VTARLYAEIMEINAKRKAFMFFIPQERETSALAIQYLFRFLADAFG